MGQDNYLIYGRRPVEELLKRTDLGTITVIEVWIMEGLPARLHDPLARAFARQIHVVPRREIDRRFPDLNHQGIVIVLESSVGLHSDAKRTWQDALTKAGGLFIALDDVQDPQNVGSIIRTAEALGVSTIFLCGSCAPLSPTVDRASSGASLHVTCFEVTNVNVLIREAKERGLWVLAAVPPVEGTAADQESQATVFKTTEHDRLPAAADSLLLLGSEGSGLGRHTIANADVLLTIPLRGNTASLNAAAAAAILIDRMVNR